MSGYQKPSDIGLVPELLALAPAEDKALLAFSHSVERADGKIPRRYREHSCSRRRRSWLALPC